MLISGMVFVWAYFKCWGVWTSKSPGFRSQFQGVWRGESLICPILKYSYWVAGQIPSKRNAQVLRQAGPQVMESKHVPSTRPHGNYLGYKCWTCHLHLAFDTINSQYLTITMYFFITLRRGPYPAGVFSTPHFLAYPSSSCWRAKFIKPSAVRSPSSAHDDHGQPANLPVEMHPTGSFVKHV